MYKVDKSKKIKTCIIAIYEYNIRNKRCKSLLAILNWRIIRFKNWI